MDPFRSDHFFKMKQESLIQNNTKIWINIPNREVPYDLDLDICVKIVNNNVKIVKILNNSQQILAVTHYLLKNY